ncbi:rhodanese-like domain-containing protein [Glaciecola siphonariae]|uniref:Rhodanese-like domain-containing protein n=1 Tax=Glaciecola siphonariae TaxID=521012 RepID=A0ABV9LZP5_9ALTE
MKHTRQKHLSILALLINLIAMLCINAFAFANVITELDHDAFQRVASTSLVVDVRTPDEYAEGHIPGAINIPLATVSDSLDMFGNKNTNIVVYCRSGYRAGKALEVLANEGFTKLNHLEGDIQAWAEAGLDMEKPG